MGTKLTTVCPKCGEPVDLFLMKKQLKQMLKDMKAPGKVETITAPETRLWK